MPSGGTLSPLDRRSTHRKSEWKVPERERRKGHEMKNRAKEKGQERRPEGKSGPRQAQGGARRGAQGRRAGESLQGRAPRRAEGGTGRETGGADTASMCGTGWCLAHRSGVWQYYGMERP